MALINCPECSKEISDRVKACPNCGYPFEEEANETEKVVAETTEKKTVNKKLILGIIVLGIIIAGISSVVYTTVAAPKKTYNQALEALESGKYDEAVALLEKIPKYEGVDTLQEQMKYESMVFTCISSLKQYLKNPDSVQLYDAKFYMLEEDEVDAEIDDEVEDGTEERNYTCIINYGAQNGFGGNTTGYALFAPGDYSLIGTCNTLDIDTLDPTEDLVDFITCSMINAYRDEGTVVGDVDLDRIKVLLKNESYSTIKIIE